MFMDFQKWDILEMMDGGFPCQQPQTPSTFHDFSGNSSLHLGEMWYAWQVNKP